MAKVAHKTGGRLLDEDSFLCVLEALGYCAKLAECTCLSKALSSRVKKVVSDTRKRAVEASGGVDRCIDEPIENVISSIGLGSQWAKWTIGVKEEGGTRYLIVRDCEKFVCKNLPVDSIRALSSHFPVFTTNIHQSVHTAATLVAIPGDLRSTDIVLIPISVKLVTRDPGLEIVVRGYLDANMSHVVQTLDERAGRRFVGNFSYHARYVQWAECSVRVTE